MKYFLLGTIFSTLLQGVTLSLPAQSHDSLDNPANKTCHLKVAWSPWPPFIEGKDTPKGIHIQLVEWIAEEMKCQITYRKLAWHESVEAIKSGEIDLLGRASLTDDRKTFAHFSQAYRESLIVLYVRRGESKKIIADSVEDLLKQGFVIGLQQGGYYGQTVMKLKAKPQYSKNFPEIIFTNGPPIDLLLDKTIDGLLESPYTIDNFLLNYKGRAQIEEFPLEIFSENLHFMFSHKSVSADFVKEFNQAMQQVRQSKAYQSHWFWKSIK